MANSSYPVRVWAITSPKIRSCVLGTIQLHTRHSLFAHCVSNSNPHILAGALRKGMEPEPLEQCWHHEGLWHQSQAGTPVPAAGTELTRAQSPQLAADASQPSHFVIPYQGRSLPAEPEAAPFSTTFSLQHLGSVC